MTAPTFLLVAALMVAALLARMIVRVVGSLRRARRNLSEARASREHQASIRLFIDAQTKLMRLDALMSLVLAVGLVAMLALARHAIILLGSA